MKLPFSLLLLGLAVRLGLSMAAFAQSPRTSHSDGYEPVLDGDVEGLYSGTLGGTATDFVCDDASHETGKGFTWNGRSWSPSEAATPGNGTFGDTPYEVASHEKGQSLQAYSVAQLFSGVAYPANLLLSGQIPAMRSTAVNSVGVRIGELANDREAIAIAIPGNAWSDLDLVGESTNLDNAIGFISPEDDVIISGTSTNDTSQEFIGGISEPLSMALMGTFLTLAGLALHRKRLHG